MSLVKTIAVKALLSEKNGGNGDIPYDNPFLWRRRGSVSAPKRKARLTCDPTSESDSELDKVANRVDHVPNFAQKTFERFNQRAHEAFDHAQEALEQVEDFVMHVWDVVSHHSLPEWLQDNEYLVTGHRPQLNSYWACFKSVFRLHSETGNIWTHLLGCIAFFTLAALILVQPSVDLEHDDKLVYTIYCTGAVLCMGFSWLFHTLYCHSEPVGKLFCKLDYCGISIMVMASFVPWIYYGFYCHTFSKIIYLTMALTFGTLCIFVSMNDKFSEPSYRPVRAGLFVAFGCSGLIPVFHFLLEKGVYRALHVSPLGWGLLMGVLYLSGAVIYAYRIPERFWPGKFDYWGQSHQIFHIFVVAAAVVNYHAMNILNKNLGTTSECALAATF